MTDRELMQQALRAAEQGATVSCICILRAALAEPVQEPFCYHDGRNIVGKEYAHHCDVFPLYTESQPEQKPLTHEQIESIWDSTLSEDVGITALRKIARAIEAAHGIKEKNA